MQEYLASFDAARAIAVVHAAGEKARLMQAAVQWTEKSDHSPVSDADKAAHDVLIEGLSAFGYRIVSEEDESHAAGGDEPFWLIDPLDGTKDFIAGRDEWAVMAGLVRNGTPVFGVVYAPRTATLWWAQKDGGSFMIKNGVTNTVRVSTTQKTFNARAVMSHSHVSEDDEARITDLGARIVRMGSAGIKICTIADGSADLYFTSGPLAQWDVCAADVILSEAGGVITDVTGKRIAYDGSEKRLHGCASSNGALHHELIKKQ